MTRKVYKSAMGKTVDLGALLLQNEQVRAVGNMNVNARGDILDSQNRVVESKNRQAQRHYRRQGQAISDTSVTKGTVQAKQAPQTESMPEDTFNDLPEDDFEFDSLPEQSTEEPQMGNEPRGGLAKAIARSREIKQELDKTARQRLQQQGVKKI